MTTTVGMTWWTLNTPLLVGTGSCDPGTGGVEVDGKIGCWSCEGVGRPILGPAKPSGDADPSGVAVGKPILGVGMNPGNNVG